MKLDKETVARRQLDTAIEMLFQGADPISVHTLACAATNIFTDLVRKAGLDTWSDHMVACFPGLEEEVRRTMRRAQNFFKHADKDHDQVLDFDTTWNDEMIIVGTLEYGELLNARGGEKISINMSVFQMWYFAKAREIFAGEGQHILRRADELFPELQTFPRFHQLALGAAVIKDPPPSRSMQLRRGTS